MDTTLTLFNKCAKNQLGFTLSRKVPLSFVKKLTYDVIEGLDFLKQELDTTHRDIKPSNLLITEKNCTIKICDFGICGNLSNDKQTQGIGTYCYMSPERHSLKQQEEYDDRADVWSFGITLAETLIGEFPYGNELKKNQISFTSHIVQFPSPQFSNDPETKLYKWFDFYDAENDDSWRWCFDFLNKCLIKRFKKDDDLNEAIRPNYATLKTLPFWRSIDPENLVDDELEEFFTEVFEKIRQPAEDKRRNSESKSLTESNTCVDQKFITVKSKN